MLGTLLLGGAPTWGQDTPKDPGKQKADQPKEKGSGSAPRAVTPQSPLDELLAKALRDNPDLVVAQVKVREAEANLNQTRLQVMQKVVALHQQLKAMRASVAEAEQRLARARKLHEQGTIPVETYFQSESALQKAKAELAKAEAEMVYLFGQQPKGVKGVPTGALELSGSLFAPSEAVVVGGKPRVPPSLVRGAMAEKIRKALDVPVKLDFKDVPLTDALELLQQKAEGVNILPQPNLADRPVSVSLTAPVPLGAVCQLIEDRLELRFVVRDYGIVAVDALNVPQGAVLLLDFWKANQKAEP
jgi:hypothetical protein